MTLRKKTLLITGVMIVGVIVILYATSQIILLSSFSKLEEQNTRQNVERALDALSDDIATLDVTCDDWASWDDTYAFIKDANEEYVESGLVDGTFIGLRLNLMLFINSSGQIVFGKAFNLQNETGIPVPQSLQEHIPVKDLLLRHPDTESSITGIVLLPEGPMLIASQPILTSEDEGPIRGTLIMGRYLTSTEIERLVEITHLSLTVHRFDDSQMSSDLQEARSSLSEKAPIFVQPLNAESVAGYALLKDIYGKPCLVLRADMPRGIYEQGQATTRFFILSLLTVGLVFGAVTMLLLEKQVLSRLARLSHNVNSISKSGDLSARVLMTGRDELSSLASEINGMLETQGQSQHKLRESEEKYRDLFENANDLIQSVTPDGHFVYVNCAWRNNLGYNEEEIVNLSLFDIIHPDSQAHYSEIFQRAMSGEKVDNVEAVFVAKDGKEISVEGNVNCQFVDGKPVYTQGIFRNITERKRAEEELRRRVEALDALWLTVLDITTMRDLSTLLHNIVKRAAQLIKAPAGGMYLCDSKRGEVHCVVSYNTPSDYIGTVLKYGNGAAGTVAQTGEPLIIDDYRIWSGRANVYEEEKPFSAVLSAPMTWEDEVIGVIHVLENSERRRFTQANLKSLTLFASHAAIAVKNARLYEQAQEEITSRKRMEEALRLSFIHLAEIVSRAMESHDPYTVGHQRKVAELARLVGEKLGFDQDRLQGLYIGGLLHDIGKISIPSEILTQPGKLSNEEWAIIRSHTRRGHEILKETEFPWPVAEMALHHHERLDGSGYPEGLKNDELSLEVRILAACDVVDAMFSHRPYRSARSKEEVIEELLSGKGVKYDSDVVDILLEILANGELDQES